MEGHKLILWRGEVKQSNYLYKKMNGGRGREKCAECDFIRVAQNLIFYFFYLAGSDILYGEASAEIAKKKIKETGAIAKPAFIVIL